MRTVLLKTIFLFTLVQIAAVLIGAQFIFSSVSVLDDPASTSNSIYLFAIIVLFAIALLIALKFYKGKMFFRLLEVAMEFTAVELLASLFLPETTAAIIAILAVAIRLIWKQTRQTLLLITVATVGALLGASLDLLPAVIFAVLLAGYDVIAVFYTKHMVTLAKNLAKREAAFSIQVEEKREKLELGTGDLVIPAMLIVAAGKTGKTVSMLGLPLNLATLLALIGAIVGVTALLYFLEHKKGYWPALPPITAGTLVGVAISAILPF